MTVSEPVARRPLEPQDERLGPWRAFLGAHTLVTRRLDEELRAEHDLSLAEYDTLLAIAWAPDRRIRMRRLADLVFLSKSGVTRLIDRLGRRRPGGAVRLPVGRPRRGGGPDGGRPGAAAGCLPDAPARHRCAFPVRDGRGSNWPRWSAPCGPSPTGRSVTRTPASRRRPVAIAERAPSGRFRAGTSGFAYPGWIPRFYPPGTRSGDLLRRYGARLDAVELNNTFYQQPSAAKVAGWLDAVSEDFRFSVKAQRGGSSRAIAGTPEPGLPWLTGPYRAFGTRLATVLFRVPDGIRAGRSSSCRAPCGLAGRPATDAGVPGSVMARRRDPSRPDRCGGGAVRHRPAGGPGAPDASKDRPVPLPAPAAPGLSAGRTRRLGRPP